jgi:hypothetical protein
MNGIENCEMERDVTITYSKDYENKVKEWSAICKEAGKKIDPETAEVTRFSVHTVDPYGVYPYLYGEYCQIGREFFARAPDSEIWVWFGDLTSETRDKLHKRPRPDVNDDDFPF